MARINVEDNWFADPLERRAALIQRIQKVPVNWTDAADGMALRAWRLAQRFWKDGRRHIPEDVWARAGLEPLIECDLAIRKTDGVYVRGTEAQHDWLIDWSEKSAKGGKARVTGAARDEKGRFQPLAGDPPATDQPLAGENPANSSPHTLSLTPSLSLHNSPNGESGKPAGSPRAPYKEFLSAWNDNRGNLPGVRSLPESLKAKIRARWSERPDLAYWAECAKKMAASSFCCEGKWASFHWLVKNDSNHVKVDAGNYDNRDDSAGGVDWSTFNWEVPP